MAPALVVPVSGPYTGAFNKLSLGTLNDDGYVLMGSYTGQEVNLSDAYGMTLVEAIWRGINWRLRIRGLEWNKPGILASMQAFGSTGAAPTTFTPTLSNIGDRYSKFGGSLILNSILGGYPPTTPNTLTASSAIVAPQSNVEYIMTSKVREAPFEFVLLPYLIAGGINLSFTTT